MIYFIRAEMTVKIGYVSDRKLVQNRLDALQIGCPNVLTILGVMDGPRSREYELHRRFDDDRCIGEWFRLSDEIVSFIEENCRPFITKRDRLNTYIPSSKPRPKPILIKAEISDHIKDFLQACERSHDVLPARKVYEAMLSYIKERGHDGPEPPLRRMSSALIQLNFLRYQDRNKRAFYGIKLPNIVGAKTDMELMSP